MPDFVTPPFFDYPTFRYYLELDVLQETANFLEWKDLNLDAPSGVRDIRITGTIADDTNVLTFDEPITFNIKGGMKIYKANGVDFVTTVEGVTAGATEIHVDETVTVETPIDYQYYESGIPYRNAAPIYDAITDEVCLAMGYTHPEQVPSDKIEQMMALGRVEAWRKVVHNTVTDTDVVVGDFLYMRTAFHQNAIKRWNTAQNEYNAKYVIPFTTPDTFVQPVTRTYSGAVKARW